VGDRLAVDRGAELGDGERGDACPEVGKDGVLEVEPLERLAAVGDLQYNARGGEMKVLVALARQRRRLTNNPIEIPRNAGRVLWTEAWSSVDGGAGCQIREINEQGCKARRSQRHVTTEVDGLRNESGMLYR
jgi:hypothetical protein